MNMPGDRKNPLWRSFGYAFSGIWTGIRKERNMKVHCMALVLVLIAGIVAKLTVVEWCICMIMCALVLSLELVNTAVEAVVDLATEEKKPLAKIAKDTAAGAVLIRRKLKESDACRSRCRRCDSGEIQGTSG